MYIHSIKKAKINKRKLRKLDAFTVVWLATAINGIVGELITPIRSILLHLHPTLLNLRPDNKNKANACLKKVAAIELDVKTLGLTTCKSPTD